MRQGRSKIFDMEDRDRQLARRQKAADMLDELMDELEKYVPGDVAKMAPKDRVSTYTKLLKFVLPPAQAEKSAADAEGEVDTEKRFSFLTNVLQASGDGMVN